MARLAPAIRRWCIQDREEGELARPLRIPLQRAKSPCFATGPLAEVPHTLRCLNALREAMKEPASREADVSGWLGMERSSIHSGTDLVFGPPRAVHGAEHRWRR